MAESNVALSSWKTSEQMLRQRFTPPHRIRDCVAPVHRIFAFDLRPLGCPYTPGVPAILIVPHLAPRLREARTGLMTAHVRHRELCVLPNHLHAWYIPRAGAQPETDRRRKPFPESSAETSLPRVGVFLLFPSAIPVPTVSASSSEFHCFILAKTHAAPRYSDKCIQRFSPCGYKILQFTHTVSFPFTACSLLALVRDRCAHRSYLVDD